MFNKEKPNLYRSLLLILIFTLSVTSVTAESKYTREKSEELFHLINWYNYTPETFEIALKEQKPIFLMISAPAWCYWCHVYESEDYLYNPILYPYINENFIPVFVDSDKRPDLTKKYLEGGWPSTTIFTPNMQRIQGFTGPRDPAGLRKYLESVVNYLGNRSYAQQILQLNYQNVSGSIPSAEQLIFLENAFRRFVEDRYDPEFGGIGLGNLPEWREGQKFPQPLTNKFLLEKYEETGNKDYLDIVTFTFENQYTEINDLETSYHLYDPVEGGFHRYTTNRDWTIPHYEKMLPDQAKFIKELTHLYKITKDKKVKFALDGTINFVLLKLYDNEGGFYSSQDAYLEDEYFGKTKDERARLEPPYIDKTRNIDSNSMMVSSFLYLYETTGDPEYSQIANKTLDFMKDNMIEEGALYYYDYDKKDAFLTGQAVSNSWALLAFVESYEVLKDNSHLETAERIAQYSLTNLYDWDSGGFFERNSPDSDFYAPNERIDLSKPMEENGVFSYGMLRLYLTTGELAYLESGLKTLGYLVDRSGGLDRMYYIMKTVELVEKNNMLETYSENSVEISKLVENKQESFFLYDLLEKNKVGLDDAPKLRDDFTNIAFILLAILAFASGVLSFLSPCTLPVLSAYFAHNFKAKKGEILKNTIFFILGLATIFAIFGMGATLIGNLLREQRIVFTRIAGLIIIVFGMLEILGKGFSGVHLKFKTKKTPVGSYFFGAVFGIGWSACIGPILASLLLLSATTGTIVKGSSLLFIYTLGLALPLIIISLYFDRINNRKFWKILKGKMLTFNVFGKEIKIHSTSLISGIILIIIGILIFNDYLFSLNQYAVQSNYVQEIIIGGEEFLKKLLLK